MLGARPQTYTWTAAAAGASAADRSRSRPPAAAQGVENEGREDEGREDEGREDERDAEDERQEDESTRGRETRTGDEDEDEWTRCEIRRFRCFVFSFVALARTSFQCAYCSVQDREEENSVSVC